MRPPPLPPDEGRRLQALRDYQMMDCAPLEAVDDLVWLAAQVCETPIGVVTLIDAERQWWMSRIGLGPGPESRELSFCAHTILEPAPLIVADTARDERFADHPQVAGPPHLRFYAGAPLRTPTGEAIGTLAVMDLAPRALTRTQEDALVRLGRQVIAQFELRRLRRNGAPPAAPPPAADHARDAVRLRVLVVDDNGVNQKVAARMLEKLGCAVEVASNGLEAVEMMLRIPFQVVFMDCMMPEMDGYEATAAIRKLSGPVARTPIVAMTANAMQGDRERCLAAGMDDYLSKPVQPDRLRQTLERWSGAILAAAATPAGAGPEPLPVDPQVLAGLRQLQEEGAPDVVTEFIDLFLADLPVRSGAILQALAAEAGEPLRAAAHTLKGSSAYIGASELARLCHDFEAAGRSGNPTASRGLAAVFQEEVDRVARYLRTQRQAPSA